MTETGNEIIDTAELAERRHEPGEEPRDVQTDAVASHKPFGKGIEFHVSMRNYTMCDMDDLIIEAAAKLILDNRNERDMAKQIEAKCIQMVSAKATEALSKVTNEIIDQPITPSFGDKKPVTMREFIGLTGREYLAVPVDSYGRARGEKDFDDYRHNAVPRIDYLVRRAMDDRFKQEIEKATDAAVREIRAALKAQHDAVLAAEMGRLREALSRAIGAQ